MLLGSLVDRGSSGDTGLGDQKCGRKHERGASHWPGIRSLSFSTVLSLGGTHWVGHTRSWLDVCVPQPWQRWAELIWWILCNFLRGQPSVSLLHLCSSMIQPVPFCNFNFYI